ncbi:hypothetical protein [Paracraurococcus lichenis]|uniref:Uncharacterized protein n=1 Tax=Paracraurococcus lichenis TaxID=3064888 RepID=A0ABT9EDT8_9PROT|nr:hypothetical protein [Paracraurococcus sp. LOR1-02]MDO9714376.1 hypothetical protein [Paracraurococcus sp. LOR1-02]
MQLSPKDIAAAEACGVTFLPATPAQVQRLAMQRKVFYADGQPILATRGDGFYETVGTLQQVIEEGLQQQRDLAAWQDSAATSEASTAADEPPLPQPEPTLVEATPELVRAMEPSSRPKRPRRGRSAAPSTDLQLIEEKNEVSATLAGPTQHAAAPTQGVTPRPAQPGRRWMVAGAARRGRIDKHWSTRQR